MKLNVRLISILLVILLLSACQMGKKDLKENYGISNVNNGEQSADDVVPNAQDLTDNLIAAKYEISNNADSALSEINKDRILAKKGGSFIDICYGLSETDTQAVFNYYKDTYSKYYVLAINGNYVYCVSDKETFKNAGFASLANFGTQLIYE